MSVLCRLVRIFHRPGPPYKPRHARVGATSPMDTAPPADPHGTQPFTIVGDPR